MFFNGNRDPENLPIYPHYANTLSSPSFYSIGLAITIGSGISTLGTAYCSGVILGPILSTIICICVYFSNKHLVRVIEFTKKSTYDHMYSFLYGPAFNFVFVVVPIIVYFCAIITYIRSIYETFCVLLYEFYPDSPSFLTSKYIVNLIFSAFILVVGSTQSLQYIAILAYVKIICLVALLICFMYIFIDGATKNELDKSSIKFFDASHIPSSVNYIVPCYLMQPMMWPNYINLKHGSVKRFNMVFDLILVTVFIFYQVIGLASYSLYASDVLNYVIFPPLKRSAVIDTARILHIILLILSLVIVQFLPRCTIIRYYSGCNRKIDVFTWVSTCVLSFIGVFILSCLESTFSVAFSYIVNFASPLLLLCAPALLYLKACWSTRVLLDVTAVINIVIGLGSCALSVVSYLV